VKKRMGLSIGLHALIASPGADLSRVARPRRAVAPREQRAGHAAVETIAATVTNQGNWSEIAPIRFQFLGCRA
jgi:hypothetical protein